MNTQPSSNSPAPEPAPGFPQESLLRPEDLIAPAASARGPWLRRSAGEPLGAARQWFVSASRRPGVRRLGVLLAIILAIGLPILAYLELRARVAPDYAEGEIDDVLDYTLLSADFNRLPIDQRLALLRELVARLKGMSAGDSELMAAFAAGITGKAREQLRENAERLAVDLWDSYSDKYKDIPLEKQSEFLDNAFLDFTKMMEDVAGFESEKTDNERIADAKKQAKRDSERARKDMGPIPEQAGRMVKMMHDRGEKLANPVQRARMTRFTRDMVRHLRNEGTPAPAPAAPTPDQPEGEKDKNKKPASGSPAPDDNKNKKEKKPGEDPAKKDQDPEKEKKKKEKEQEDKDADKEKDKDKDKEKEKDAKPDPAAAPTPGAAPAAPGSAPATEKPGDKPSPAPAAAPGNPPAEPAPAPKPADPPKPGPGGG